MVRVWVVYARVQGVQRVIYVRGHNNCIPMHYRTRIIVALAQIQPPHCTISCLASRSAISEWCIISTLVTLAFRRPSPTPSCAYTQSSRLATFLMATFPSCRRGTNFNTEICNANVAYTQLLYGQLTLHV